LAATLSRLFEEPIKLSAAGRTDTGVHASGQVVSFTTARSFPFDRLAIALNSALPSDISVRECAVVDANFSARFSAMQRRYVFVILRRREASALLARYAYHVWRDLDVAPMLEGARHLLGTHDFTSFCGVIPDNGNTVRTVAALDVEERGDLLRLHVAADGFLHRMVRTIAGTLVECGADDVTRVATRRPGRAHADGAAIRPAASLYLAGVRYPDGYDSLPSRSYSHRRHDLAQQPLKLPRLPRLRRRSRRWAA